MNINEEENGAEKALNTEQSDEKLKKQASKDKIKKEVSGLLKLKQDSSKILIP